LESAPEIGALSGNGNTNIANDFGASISASPYSIPKMHGQLLSRKAYECEGGLSQGKKSRERSPHARYHGNTEDFFMDTKDIDWSALEEPQEIVHEFEIDLYNTVIANHSAMREGIDHEEEDELLEIKDALPIEDYERVGSLSGYLQGGYDVRRGKGRLTAVVALVTRFEHWILKFTSQLEPKPTRVHKNRLANLVEALNNALSDGPVTVKFFEELAELRHSVVHEDSRAEWDYKGQRRRIAECYRNAWGDAELSEEQLKEAIQKSIQQVKWYDERMPS
jgi:hypothetical protein